MRRVTPIILLSLFCSSAAAEWTLLNTSKSDGTETYIDKSTVSRKGNKARLWYLDNFASPEMTSKGRKYLSSKGLHEFDCQDARRQLLQYTWYTDQMGRGEIVFAKNEPSDNGQEIVPQSIAEAMYKIACGKK